MKFVEGNASVYQVKSVSPISGEGRVWRGGGAGEGGELQQRDLQHVEVFNTLADFDVSRLKESEGGANKRLALAFRRDLDSVTFVVSVDIPCFGMIFGVVYFLKYFGSR